MSIKVGDRVICIDIKYFGVRGVVTQQYFPTACEEQTMVMCDDGRMFHAPTRLFKKENGNGRI